MRALRPATLAVVVAAFLSAAPCGSEPSLLNPDDVTYDPETGKFYGPDGNERGAPSVAPFLKNRGWRSNPATGQIFDEKGGEVDPSKLYPSPDTTPTGTTYDPTTKTFFAADGVGRTVTLPPYLHDRGYQSDSVTGEIYDRNGDVVDPTTLFPAPSTEWILRYDPKSGKYYTASGNESPAGETAGMRQLGWRYDAASGQWIDPTGKRLAPEDVFDPPTDANPNGMSYDPKSGKYFDAEGNLIEGSLPEFMTDQGWTLDPATGAITNPTGATVDPSTMFPAPIENPGGFLYDPATKRFVGGSVPPTPDYLAERGGSIDPVTGEVVEEDGTRHDPSTYFPAPSIDTGFLYDAETGKFYLPNGLETPPTLPPHMSDLGWEWNPLQNTFVDPSGNNISPSTLCDEAHPGELPSGDPARTAEPQSFRPPAGWTTPSGPAGGSPLTHVVQRGENLFRIALQYGTSMDAIASANGISETTIFPGQVLTIPTSADSFHPGDTPVDMSLVNTDAASFGARLPTMQLEIIIIVRIRLLPAPERASMPDLERRAANAGFVMASGRSHSSLAGALGIGALMGSQNEPSAPRIKGLFTALGGSTGDVFEAEFLNEGSQPMDIGANGLVLEPLAGRAQDAARSEFIEAAAGRPTTKAGVKAYCLEFLREPPAPGTVFRVAAPEIQQQFQEARSVLTAAKRLFEAGGLSPDSDPGQYFDAMRQWSIWARERGFDLESFGEAFVDRTRKNFEAADQPFTDEVQGIIRGLIPNRWSDVQKILTEADRIEAAFRP